MRLANWLMVLLCAVLSATHLSGGDGDQDLEARKGTVGYNGVFEATGKNSRVADRVTLLGNKVEVAENFTPPKGGWTFKKFPELTYIDVFIPTSGVVTRERTDPANTKSSIGLIWTEDREPSNAAQFDRLCEGRLSPPSRGGKGGRKEDFHWAAAVSGGSKIAVWSRLSGQGQYRESGTRVLAGGLKDALHLADVEILFDPPLSPSDEVKISFVGSDGGGHDFSPEWWSTQDAKPAEFRYGKKKVAHGEEAISVTGITTKLSGATVRSSNKKESATLRVEVNGHHADHTIAFDIGEFKVTFPDQLAAFRDWEKVSIEYTFEGRRIPGHELVMGIDRVWLTGRDEPEEAKEGTSMTDAVSLHSYVQMDKGAIFSHRYDKKTSKANRPASTEARIIDPRVTKYSLAVGDLEVWTGD